MSDSNLNAYNIFELREMAMKRVPRGMFELVDRAVEDEVALRNNRAAFERIKLRPRTLVDVSSRNQEITLFGNKHKMPIAIAPTGAAGMMWHEGEIALARAAKAAGIPFTLAISSQTSLERVAEQAGGRLWMQIYMWADRSLSHQLVERARVAGYEALVVTVDSMVPSNREYKYHSGFNIPFTYNHKNVTDVLTHPRWLFGVLARYLLTTGMPRCENYPSQFQQKITEGPKAKNALKNDSLTWEDLKVLRKLWQRTLIVKGILHPRDAVLAADCGADAVVVSNHGGRQLDSSQAPIEVLPEVVDAVGNRITVMVDSGFRRGSDVVKALALGAKAVLVGRATLYGAAAAGQTGATRAIEIFHEEIDRVMAQIGSHSVAELNPEYVIRR